MISKALLPQIRNKEEFENALVILRDKNMPPSKRLSMLNVTQETVWSAFTRDIIKDPISQREM